jgi:hypothetical protein
MQSATAFLVGGAHDTVGNQTLEGQLQQRMDDLDDVVTTMAATFLGLTVNCARCHDHKFDPISQKDYYALQAVFAGVQHSQREVRVPLRSAPADLVRADGKGTLRPPVHPRSNIERFDPVEVRFVRFTIRATQDGSEPCIDELEVYTAEETPRNVALAALGTKATASSVFPNNPLHKLEHINDGRHGNGRSWISAAPGKGWVQLEFPRPVKIARILWGRDREEKYRDRLAVDYVIEGAVELGRWRVLASSADRRRNDAASANSVYAGIFTQPGPTHLLLRGDPLRKGVAVAPAGLSGVGPKLSLPPNAPESQRRVALARWLGNPDNPLTARVLVNRVWHYHFGQGLVATPSDFGFNGERPSHPELLDWLASEFMHGANGKNDSGRWNLKPLHRLIVTSATYRQSGRLNARSLALDKQNRLLWRMAPRRLEAEAIRDAILATSGHLDRRMGGPGYNLWEKNTNYVTVFKPKARLGPEEFRRMVYQFKPRSQQDPTFGDFDCPDAALARPRRTTSTTVLQALNLLNGRFLIDQADYFAQRLHEEAGDDPARQVGHAFRLAFGRKPSEKELIAAVALVREHGTAALCRALYNANEFLYVD